MFTTNPFAELSTLISPPVMQGYVVVMVLLVIAGTILDMVHKGSAKYFFENAKKAEKNAPRALSSAEKRSLAMATLANEVLTSSELESHPERRISHLFMMYGFVIFVLTTAILIFAYPTPDSPAPGIVPLLWRLGALSLCFGGYWFWFFIRVDVSSEGHPWYRLAQGDIFIVSLITMATFALLWSWTLSSAGIWNALFLALFIISSTLLFSTVMWSKFAHMFFKPAAAYQKRVTRADGSRENLPDDYDLTDPAVQQRFPDIPEYMGKNPPNMGLGIKRETADHY